MKVVSPSGAGRGVWGVGSPFKRLANSASPAPRGECESSPQSRLNCALPLGAGALGRASAFLQRARLGLPPPLGALRPLRFARALDLRSARLPYDSARAPHLRRIFGGLGGLGVAWQRGLSTAGLKQLNERGGSRRRHDARARRVRWGAADRGALARMVNAHR